MAAGASYSIPFESKYHGVVGLLNKQEYPPDNVDRARDIELRNGDMLILLYPRTGRKVGTLFYISRKFCLI